MFLGSWYIDPLYLWIFVITLVISIATQAYLRSVYKKWSNIKNSASLNGIQVGQQIIMGLSGEDRFWPGLGLLADILSYIGVVYGNRDRIPG